MPGTSPLSLFLLSFSSFDNRLAAGITSGTTGDTSDDLPQVSFEDFEANQ
jgi:hypothetical protein